MTRMKTHFREDGGAREMPSFRRTEQILRSGGPRNEASSLALFGQVVRLLAHLLDEIPYDRLRYAERQRLHRLLDRLLLRTNVAKTRLESTASEDKPGRRGRHRSEGKRD